MNDFFTVSNRIYQKMSDDLSQRIYRAGVAYNLTKDEKCLDDTISERFCDNCSDDLLEFAGTGNKSLYVFGIGTWGSRIYEILNRNNIEIVGFIDNAKNTKEKFGIPVVNPSEVSNPEDAKVVLAVEKQHSEIMQQLRERGFAEKYIWDIGKKINDANKELEEKQYFDLEEMKPTGQDVFVDCGGFDGKSSERFSDWCAGQYNKIYIFEANTELINICKNVSEKLRDCDLINKGVWNEEKELVFYESPYDKEFNVIMSDHNCLDESKKREDWIEHRVPVVRMDDIIDEPISFLKMDIEGSEASALEGAERLIRTYKPRCAISVYHKSDDLWTIPALLLKYNPDYKFYLRHYSLGWGETVLYAL